MQKWNSRMAMLGQTWADRCAFDHGQPQFSAQQVGFDKLGQNLYVSSDPAKTVADGVQAWFDEKADFNYDTLGCQPGKACGHYTQVRIHCWHSVCAGLMVHGLTYWSGLGVGIRDPD